MNDWVERFVSEAFRRPLSEEEVTWWHAVFEQGPDLLQSGDNIADGVQMVISTVLQSPDFLYRIERTGPKSTPWSI